MSFSFFDSHCHFDFDIFDHDRELLWQDCLSYELKHLLIPGVSPLQWNKARALAKQYQGVYMSAGLHPWWVGSANLPNRQQWQSYLDDPDCVALGECGLDRMVETPLDLQLEVFEQHLQMAVDLAMPLIIHVRQTHNEILRYLKRYRPPKGGIIHGFSGSEALAREYWQLGFYLGVGGSITYERAQKTRRAIKAMPLEALVLETDAPDMPLYGYQGQRNTPLRVLEVARSLAQLRGCPLDHLARQTTANAKYVFSIPN